MWCSELFDKQIFDKTEFEIPKDKYSQCLRKDWRVWRYQRVIRVYELNKDRQHSGQKKNNRTNNDLWNTTQKTKDRTKPTPLKIVGEPMCSRRVSSICSTSDTLPTSLVTKPVISHEWGKDRTLSLWTLVWILDIFLT